MAAGATTDPDAGLVARMQAGDQSALAEVMRRHGPKLRMLALRISGSNSSADDIVQESFIAAWRAIGRWQPGGPPFAAWLTRIAVRRAIDADRRSRVRRFFGLEAAEEIADAAVAADASLLMRTELRAVAADIAALPARQRAAILLAAGGENSNGDIATALGISEGAAEQLLVRARRTLRESLARREAYFEKETS